MKKFRPGKTLGVLAACSALFLWGCGDANVFDSMSNKDSGSNEAKLENAITAINDGDYQKAIDYLNSLPDSDEKRKYLSSAYMGLAGFDTLTLVSKIDETKDLPNNEVIFTTIGALFDTDKNGVISTTDLAIKLDYVNKAMLAAFTGSDQGDFSTVDVNAQLGGMTNDRIVQAGVGAAMHTVLTIASQLPASTSGDVVIDPVKYKELYPAGAPDFPSTPLPGIIPALNNDIQIMVKSVDAIDQTSKDNDLKSDIDTYLTNIGGPDKQVTAPEVDTYIKGLK